MNFGKMEKNYNKALHLIPQSETGLLVSLIVVFLLAVGAVSGNASKNSQIFLIKSEAYKFIEKLYSNINLMQWRGYTMVIVLLPKNGA